MPKLTHKKIRKPMILKGFLPHIYLTLTSQNGKMLLPMGDDPT